MSIYGKNDKLRKWRYSVQQMDLKIPGKDTIKIEKDRIVELSIVENYEALYFPLIKLSVVLDDSVYYKILVVPFAIFLKFHLISLFLLSYKMNIHQHFEVV